MASKVKKSGQNLQKQKSPPKSRGRFYHTNSELTDSQLDEMVAWVGQMQAALGLKGIAKHTERGFGWWQRFAVITESNTKIKRQLEHGRFRTIHPTEHDYDELYNVWRVWSLLRDDHNELFEDMLSFMEHYGAMGSVFSKVIDRVWRMAGKPEGYEPKVKFNA